jgi:hypothetical protein
MSVAAAQASAFYEQVVAAGSVFTFVEDGSYLVFPVNGKDVVPFWSSRSRIETVQRAHPRYAAYAISEESLKQFLEKTLDQLEEENINVGVNWSGERSTGYDISAADVKRNICHHQSKANEG